MGLPTPEELTAATDDLICNSLNILTMKIGATAKAKGFHDPKEREPGVIRDASPGERMMLIVTEVAEMMEAYRVSKNPSQFYIEVDGKPEGVASEVADVIIRCLDYCDVYKIDIGTVILHKMAYNTTRSHQHGGKAL